MTCVISYHSIAGPCRVCGVSLNERIVKFGAASDAGRMDAAHVCDDGLYCALHCPVHRQAPHFEDSAAPQSTAGEQKGLFDA